MEERARLEHLFLEERARAEAEKKAEKRTTALYLKNLGMAVAEIAIATRLSIEEIENLE